MNWELLKGEAVLASFGVAVSSEGDTNQGRDCLEKRGQIINFIWYFMTDAALNNFLLPPAQGLH